MEEKEWGIISKGTRKMRWKIGNTEYMIGFRGLVVSVDSSPNIDCYLFSLCRMMWSLCDGTGVAGYAASQRYRKCTQLIWSWNNFQLHIQYHSFFDWQHLQPSSELIRHTCPSQTKVRVMGYQNTKYDADSTLFSWFLPIIFFVQSYLCRHLWCFQRLYNRIISFLWLFYSKNNKWNVNRYS